MSEEKPVATVAADNQNEDHEEEGGEVAPSPEIHFEPVIKLEQVETHTGEEDDECLYKVRAKMYRFDKEGNEWKERGTGDLKLLKSKRTGHVRVLMRREKTHKICANHLVVEGMELKASVSSDKSWIYQTVADFSEGESRPETLTVRFANADHAKEFKEKFEEAKQINKKLATGDDLAGKVSALKIEGEEETGKDKACEKKECEKKECCKETKAVEAEAKKEECKCANDESCKEKCVGCNCGCQN